MIKTVNLRKSRVLAVVAIWCNIFGAEQEVNGLQCCLNNSSSSTSLALVRKQFFHRTYPQLPMYSDSLTDNSIFKCWNVLNILTRQNFIRLNQIQRLDQRLNQIINQGLNQRQEQIINQRLDQCLNQRLWCLQMGSVFQKSMTHVDFELNNRKMIRESLLEFNNRKIDSKTQKNSRIKER